MSRPQLLAIVGPRGRGKTGLAAGLCRYFHERERGVLHTTAQAYLDGWQTRSGEQRASWREKYEKRHLVVFDELQERRVPDWLEAQFVDLLNKRYANFRATVLISNLQPKALVSNVGELIWRRLQEEGGIFETPWGRIQELLFSAGREGAA